MLEDLCHRGAGSEVLLPVETALDDIPALAVTAEDAFRLSQGRPIVLLPRQVETLKARLASRLERVRVSNRFGDAWGSAVSICEMRAGQLQPDARVQPLMTETPMSITAERKAELITPTPAPSTIPARPKCRWPSCPNASRTSPSTSRRTRRTTTRVAACSSWSPSAGSLLDHLKKSDQGRYQALIETLGLRR